MTTSYRKNNLLLSFFLLSVVNAWEIPSFLLENDQQHEEFSSSERQLANSTQIHLPLFNDQGFLDPPIFSDQGTATPTESPAPSPSPSDGPTITPTITGNPTSKPTASPTESPAPSPSPSETPTSAPSGKPSIPPSENPTVSNPPSMMPSVAPSDGPTTLPSISPSMSPTISSPPSLSPSQSPSDAPTTVPSVFPSSSPTLIDEVSADFSVQLAIESGNLSESQIGALQKATVGFLSNDISLIDGTLKDIIVQFIGQVVIDASNMNSTTSKNVTRLLFDNLSLQQNIVVDFSVSALYSGSDNLFNLKTALSPYFHDPTSRWFKWLSTADTVFTPLAPQSVSNGDTASVETTSNSTADKGVPGGTIAVVTILALASLTVGIAASIYAIRQYRRNTYGQELISPRQSSEGFGSYTEDNIEIEQQGHRAIVTKSKSSLRSQINGDVDNKSVQSWMKPPTTPNSLEMGKAIPIAEILKKNPRPVDNKEEQEDPWNHIQLNKSDNRLDPPTANSLVNAPINKTNDRKFQDPRQIGSLLDTNTEISEMTRSQMAGHEIMLTKSMGGTLGAAAIAGSVANSGFTTSDFSDHGKSFFEQGNIQKNRGPDRTSLLRQQTSTTNGNSIIDSHVQSYESATTRGGLYDVFAPPGPIGIVVDTTKDGPAVHSLKRTSPMLGLINPGDLIVALDDVDARGMTAATLTQLMAKKSTQKERKITLLSVDNL